MSISALTGIIGICTAMLLLFGLLYALQVYERPPPPEWISLSVVIGVAFTEILTWIIIQMVLIYLDSGHLWWLAFIPLVAYLITGVPQIIGERIKHHNQTKLNNEINRRLENG